MLATLEHWKVIKVIETVLIVDGNPDTRQTLKLILELNGYRTVEAINGIEGLQILGEWDNEIHLALCAEELSDMTTGQWRGQLRFLSPQIPSLIISDRERNEIADMPVEFGVGISLVKLPNHIRLLERIRIALDERFFANRARLSAA
jgi:DNA-binding response OmpR family regulator